MLCPQLAQPLLHTQFPLAFPFPFTPKQPFPSFPDYPGVMWPYAYPQ